MKNNALGAKSGKKSACLQRLRALPAGLRRQRRAPQSAAAQLPVRPLYGNGMLVRNGRGASGIEVDQKDRCRPEAMVKGLKTDRAGSMFGAEGCR